ncbi:hypothetical protein VP01_289g10 [Puccinia sorghi]|uniref:Uncharacterized protein n=1 Tax=Puccinia sorghi TaxID=27349 RepID=A0A0L6V1G4_9BASI|nr:hypothetical protein VP01_289g10 [Puccinia sorghi]
MEWLEYNNKVIGSLDTTISLLIRQRTSNTKRSGSKFGCKEINRIRLKSKMQLYG